MYGYLSFLKFMVFYKSIDGIIKICCRACVKGLVCGFKREACKAYNYKSGKQFTICEDDIS